MLTDHAGNLITKSDHVRALLADGKDIDALRIAKGFRWLGDHKVTIQRGWEAHTNPSFMRQLGRDPDQALADGIEALRTLYG